MERVGQVLVETYRVERLVAEGGMAAVYEARHLRVPKRFAVKFLRNQLQNHAEALARFRREAEIIATLEHPNIVQLVDYNVTDDGLPYIVLEFLDGEDLGARMARDGRIGLVDTLKIARQTAAALEAAHARDVTHRDLKPGNVFLTREGQVKVLDFGVAKLRRAPELTAMNVVVGTVGYMSPEQISGKEVDPRTDQFALASIVYAMLAGEPAFEIDGPVVVQANRILTHRPPDIAGISPAVNAALQRGLAKNPFERYATVTELVEALIAAAGATVAQRISQEFDVAPTTDPASELGTATEPGATDLPAMQTTITDPRALADPYADVVTAEGATLPPQGDLPTERTAITIAPAPSGDEREPPTDPTALADDGSPTIESMPAVTGEIDSHAALRMTLPRDVEPGANGTPPNGSAQGLATQKTVVTAAADASGLPPRSGSIATSAADAVPIAERITLKPQQAPPELEALRARARAAGNTADTTSKQILPKSRVGWIIFGAAAGGGLATIVYLIASR
jgi:serine/threonine protein kinase